MYMYSIGVLRMASRNIAITEDLYFALERKKRRNESFTKVIKRLMVEHDRPSNYFGAWADMSKDEEKELTKARKEIRTLWKDRRTD